MKGLEALKRITRDDTEHGKHYYLADEVDALLAQPEQERPHIGWLARHIDGSCRLLTDLEIAASNGLWKGEFKLYSEAQPKEPIDGATLATLAGRGESTAWQGQHDPQPAQPTKTQCSSCHNNNADDFSVNGDGIFVCDFCGHEALA